MRKIKFVRKSPKPSYHNVEPAGPGLYRFDGQKYRLWDGEDRLAVGAIRQLSREDLFQFAKDAARALK